MSSPPIPGKRPHVLQRVCTMSSRRYGTSFMLVSMVFTMWSACWGEPLDHPFHRGHHHRPPEEAPPPGSADSPGRSDSRAPGEKVKYPGQSNGAPVSLDQKDRAPAMRAGERMDVDDRSRRDDRRVRSVPAQHAGGGARDDADRRDPARGGRSPSRGHPAVSPATGRARPAALPTRPNMLVLLLDDQDAFTPYWEAMPRTAAMVQNGVTFQKAFSPTPICSPGRCTFLTGRLAHNTGVYTLSGPHGPAVFGRETTTEFSVGLSQLGYINGYFGKTWGSDAPNPGWQRWCAVGGNNMYTGYGYDVTDYSQGGPVGRYTSDEYVTDFIADRAVAFVQDGIPAGQPFLICLAPTAPHLPLPPAPRDIAYAKRRWEDRLPIRPNFNEPDVHDKSRWLRDTAFVRSECVPYAPHEYHKRMGSLMAVDQMMGRLQSLLIQQGRWNNTIVFVTSDNGYNLGSHRLIHKMAPYEESIRVPMYAAGPGIASGTITKMVGLHDLAPTFLELAGGRPTPEMDGKPLGAFLASGSDSAAPDWRTVLLTEYDTGGVHPGFNPGGAMQIGWELDIPTYRSVRTETSKYIVWLATGEEEVYNLINDPYELNNLTRADPGAAVPLLGQLRPLLSAVKGCVGGGCP